MKADARGKNCWIANLPNSFIHYAKVHKRDFSFSTFGRLLRSLQMQLKLSMTSRHLCLIEWNWILFVRFNCLETLTENHKRKRKKITRVCSFSLSFPSHIGAKWQIHNFLIQSWCDELSSSSTVSWSETTFCAFDGQDKEEAKSSKVAQQSNILN